MVEIAGTQKTTDTKGFATLAQAIALTETTSLVGIDVTKDEVIQVPAPNHAATTTLLAPEANGLRAERDLPADGHRATASGDMGTQAIVRRHGRTSSMLVVGHLAKVADGS
jgi:hypothetical protein